MAIRIAEPAALPTSRKITRRRRSLGRALPVTIERGTAGQAEQRQRGGQNRERRKFHRRDSVSAPHGQQAVFPDGALLDAPRCLRYVAAQLEHFAMHNSIIPYPTVIEQTGRGERQFDIFSRLLVDRVVFLGTAVDDGIANLIIAQLLFLQMSDAKKDVHLYINSPGGSVTAGLAIYDTMQYLTCDVNTYCIGQAASMGAVLLSAGTKGKRFALPNARIMIHQPWGGVQGQASDISIQAKEILRLKDRLNEILAKACGKTVDAIGKDTDRDNFMSADEAKNYGLVDQVVQSRKEIVGVEKSSVIP